MAVNVAWLEVVFSLACLYSTANDVLITFHSSFNPSMDFFDAVNFVSKPMTSFRRFFR
jgi:hypothetical protein